MNHKQFTKSLEESNDASLRIMLPTDEFVPDHFHVTEVGRVQKTFVDCGGTCRQHAACVLQVWTAKDFDHRLKAGKLAKIMKLAEPILGWSELSVEVEFGEDVAALYKLSDVVKTANGLVLVLASKKTECLAPDKCGVTGCC